MMPSIHISQSTFERLQQFAEPLVDTPESIIRRILDSYESNAGGKGPSGEPPRPPARDVRNFDPLRAPKLTHTRLLRAIFAGVELPSPRWNSLLAEALKQAKKRGYNAAALQRIARVNIVNGQKNNDGYRYYADSGISVQGQDANASWHGVIHIARELNLPVEVEFAWRDKEGAERPGESGKMIFNGASKP